MKSPVNVVTLSGQGDDENFAPFPSSEGSEQQHTPTQYANSSSVSKAALVIDPSKNMYGTATSHFSPFASPTANTGDVVESTDTPPDPVKMMRPSAPSSASMRSSTTATTTTSTPSNQYLAFSPNKGAAASLAGPTIYANAAAKAPVGVAPISPYQRAVTRSTLSTTDSTTGTQYQSLLAVGNAEMTDDSSSSQYRQFPLNQS
jgi:hypothetical protein